MAFHSLKNQTFREGKTEISIQRGKGRIKKNLMKGKKCAVVAGDTKI